MWNYPPRFDRFNDSTRPSGLAPLDEATLLKYAIEGGGDYWVDYEKGLVVTRVEDWTVTAEFEAGSVLEHGVMRALYRPIDEVQFKIARRGGFHDLLGRIFGSKEVDVGDPVLHKEYSVQTNDEHRIRTLVMSREFQDLWARCAHPASSRNVIDRFETKPYRYNRQAQVEDRQIQVKLSGLWGLDFVHDLLAHTLRELTGMGAASREFVDFEDKVLWGELKSRKEPLDQHSWPAAEEWHFELGVKLYDRGKWKEAVGHLEAVITLNPQNVDAHVQRGRAYAKLGNTELAIADLERAGSLTDDPDTLRIVEGARRDIGNRIE